MSEKEDTILKLLNDLREDLKKQNENFDALKEQYDEIITKINPTKKVNDSSDVVKMITNNKNNNTYNDSFSRNNINSKGMGTKVVNNDIICFDSSLTSRHIGDGYIQTLFKTSGIKRRSKYSNE